MGIETIAALGIAALAANQIASSVDEGNAKSDQRNAIGGAQRQIGAYRPQITNAMQQGLMNQSGALQGANNVLASLYGPGGAGVPAGLTKNPMDQVFGTKPPPGPSAPPGALAGPAMSTVAPQVLAHPMQSIAPPTKYTTPSMVTPGDYSYLKLPGKK